jgi:hypothetical protein
MRELYIGRGGVSIDPANGENNIDRDFGEIMLFSLSMRRCIMFVEPAMKRWQKHPSYGTDL